MSSNREENQFIPVATGPYGLVGRGLWKEFSGLIPVDIVPPPPDFPAPLVSLPPADITNLSQLTETLGRVATAFPGKKIVLFHLAAMTDTRGDQMDLFEKVNVLGTENVLKVCRGIGATMIHISTDYVFEMQNKSGGSYTEDDRPSVQPQTAYSLSKYKAENLVLDQASAREARVARIAFPYGGTGPRLGLAEKYLQKMKENRQTKQPMKLFSDQRICPSYISDIVRGLRAITTKIVAGDEGQRVFHLTGEATTPLDFGKTIRRIFGYDDVAIESSSVQGTRYSPNLGLSTEKTQKTLGWRPTSIEQALSEYKKIATI